MGWEERQQLPHVEDQVLGTCYNATRTRRVFHFRKFQKSVPSQARRWSALGGSRSMAIAEGVFVPLFVVLVLKLV